MQELLNLFEQNGSIHVFVFTVNILLFLLAAPIVKAINGDTEHVKHKKGVDVWQVWWVLFICSLNIRVTQSRDTCNNVH